MIATLLFLCAQAPAEAADGVLARYDLPRSLIAFDGEGFLESMTPFRRSRYFEWYRTDVGDLYANEDPDMIPDLVSRVFVEEFEYEGRAIESDEDGILVYAPPAAQERVANALTEFQRVLAAHVELQVDVITLPDEGPIPLGGGGLVDVSALGDLGSARERSTYRMRVFAGRTSVLESIRTIPLLTEYDVEIAQGATIHDPEITEAEIGTRLLVRAAPSSAGLNLALFYSHSEPMTDAPTTVNAKQRTFVAQEGGGGKFVEAPGMTERLDVSFRTVAFNSLLPPDKALVFSSSLDLAGAKSRELVILRRVKGDLPRYHRFKPAGTSRELLFVNAEALSPPRIQVDELMMYEDITEVRAPHSTASLYMSMPSFLFDNGGELFSTWRTMGPWMICIYDPAWDNDAADRLEALLAGWKDDARVVTASLSAHSRGHGGASPVSWSLPLRSGAGAAVLSGIASSALVEYDVEVAGFSAAADPQMAPILNGLIAGIRSSRAGDALGLEVDFLATLQRGPLRQINTGGPYINNMEQPTMDYLRAHDYLTVDQAGGRFVFGNEIDDADSVSLQLNVH